MLDEIVHEVTLTISPTLRRATVVLHQSIPIELALDSYPGPLGQVLLNLINNAVVHAYEKQSDKQLWISAVASDNGWITLNVRDNGAGIAKEHLKRIFDPFYTTRLGQGGSGLGLHITYTLVTGILGGRIEVTNTAAGGASFTLHLPLKAAMTSQITQQHDV
jgi:C4-dicarboxylate-specific signal transduction histidine kinase